MGPVSGVLSEGFSEKAWTLCGFQAGVGADCQENLGLSWDQGWGGEAGVVAEGPHSSDAQGQRPFWLVSGMGPRATSGSW